MSRMSRIGSKWRALPSMRTPARASGSGSIFRPSMPTTLWPSLSRWCASV